MSFGGVDEKKLVAEAAAQLPAVLKPVLADALGGLHDLLDEVLANHKVTITIERKDP